MIKLQCDDPEVLEAMMRQQHTADFQLIRDWIHLQLWDLRKSNDTKAGVDRDWTQGACQAVQSILDTIETSGKTLIALRGRGGP